MNMTMTEKQNIVLLTLAYFRHIESEINLGFEHLEPLDYYQEFIKKSIINTEVPKAFEKVIQKGYKRLVSSIVNKT